MKAIFNFLKGYKTVIFSIIVILIGILEKFGVNTGAESSTLYIIIGAVVAFLRSITDSPIFKAYK